MVTWSDPAKADLRHIFEYIAHDSHHYAKKVIQEIVDKTGVLNELPRIGRAVPEVGDEACGSFPSTPTESFTRSSGRTFTSWPWRINGGS